MASHECDVKAFQEKDGRQSLQMALRGGSSQRYENIVFFGIGAYGIRPGASAADHHYSEKRDAPC